jgi:co-chaperonin GroES (HSP10)
VRQVRAALGCRATGGGRRVRRVDRRSRSRSQAGHVGKYTSQEIKLDGEEYLIMREDEVLAVIETG